MRKRNAFILLGIFIALSANAQESDPGIFTILLANDDGFDAPGFITITPMRLDVTASETDMKAFRSLDLRLQNREKPLMR
jgi:hypothetical protein